MILSSRHRSTNSPTTRFEDVWAPVGASESDIFLTQNKPRLRRRPHLKRASKTFNLPETPGRYNHPPLQIQIPSDLNVPYHHTQSRPSTPHKYGSKPKERENTPLSSAPSSPSVYSQASYCSPFPQGPNGGSPVPICDEFGWEGWKRTLDINVAIPSTPLKCKSTVEVTDLLLSRCCNDAVYGARSEREIGSYPLAINLKSLLVACRPHRKSVPRP